MFVYIFRSSILAWHISLIKSKKNSKIKKMMCNWSVCVCVCVCVCFHFIACMRSRLCLAKFIISPSSLRVWHTAEKEPSKHIYNVETGSSRSQVVCVCVWESLSGAEREREREIERERERFAHPSRNESSLVLSAWQADTREMLSMLPVHGHGEQASWKLHGCHWPSSLFKSFISTHGHTLGDSTFFFVLNMHTRSLHGKSWDYQRTTTTIWRFILTHWNPKIRLYTTMPHTHVSLRISSVIL